MCSVKLILQQSVGFFVPLGIVLSNKKPYCIWLNNSDLTEWCQVSE